MPQLSLYVDDETLRRLQRAAKLENVSVSKYVVNKLNRIIRVEWPENYEKLFGAITDETFEADRPASFADDTSRETL